MPKFNRLKRIDVYSRAAHVTPMTRKSNSPNLLYYGDNLEVLRLYVADKSVDLIYLDPPFNSNQDYNVLFREHDGTRSAAQIRAFEDTWRWDEAAALTYLEVVEGGGRVSQVMQAFRTFLGDTDMLAYLTMMAPRLVELRRVLKPTGSIYLHCDPTASHYLKMLLDAVFDPRNFRNEIIWKRTSSHNDARKFADIHDCILYYCGRGETVWNPQYVPQDENYVRTHYTHKDKAGRRYRLDNIIRSASMGPRPNLSYEYKGYTPKWGWRVVREKLEALDETGRIEWTRTNTPYLVRYLDEMKGKTMPSLWTDIPPINSQAAERLGYPTQKPEALLERILSASSNKGDTVLDPFCGCGTTVVAAQKLKRRWIGIDITHLAITLIRHRLRDAFDKRVEFELVGEPVTVSEAIELAHQDRFQFQWWALGLVGARPVEQKKGADQGIDGRLYFHDEGTKGKTKQIVISVKSGKVGVKDVRDLRAVIDREKAAIGVLITLEPPTRPMRTEASSVGFYDSPWGTRHTKLQILKAEELLAGKQISYPSGVSQTFKRAPKKPSDPGSIQESAL